MSGPIHLRPGHEPGRDSSWVRTLTGRFALPPDLLAKARRRLGTLALAFVILPAVFFPIVLWSGEAYHPLLAAAVGSTPVVSLALFLATRSRRLGDGMVLGLGLVWEVLLCLLASSLSEWNNFEQTGRPGDLTFATVIIVIFPLIVPCTPWLTLASSVVAAAMAPLGIFVMHWLGVIGQPQLPDLVQAGVGPAAAVILATMGSRVIDDLGTELTRARELGSYTLVERLGSGGMGEVWRARHRLLSRPAAIKLIKPEALGGDQGAARDVLRRFELEAQATASLRSPHTVEVYDFGTSPEGTFYYVMELLDGVDLGALVERHGALPARRVVHLLLQVCHSLHEAHGVGLVHRDIKPSNIFVGRYGADVDFAKVLDFGLVKHSAPTGPDLESRLTQMGGVLGTPAFIAPEVVMDGAGVDARVDLYALGCVAYWLLTGSQVFPAKNPVEALVRHVKDPPEAPSTRTELPIPQALDALVLACLCKDPGERPQSAAALAGSLRALDLDPWTEAEGRTWWDRTYPTEA